MHTDIEINGCRLEELLEEYHQAKLKLLGFNITDKNIATIEELHDLLLEEYPLNHPLLKEVGELTKRMYKAIG